MCQFLKNRKKIHILTITSAALPTIGNKTKPTKVLLNPKDCTTPSIEPIKHLEEKITTMNTTANKLIDIISDDLG